MSDYGNDVSEAYKDYQRHAGTTGAYRQSWRRINPRSILASIIRNHPDWEETEIQTECWNQIRTNQEFLYEVYSYWFHNNYKSFFNKGRRSPRKRNDRAETTASTAAFTSSINASIEQAVEKKARIKLRELLMSSGKTLGDSTREDLLVEAGWKVRVANQLMPGQTVNESGLTDDQLWELQLPPQE